MQKDKPLFFIFLIIIIAVGLLKEHQRSKLFSKDWGFRYQQAVVDSVFELKKGDILVRPNWNWLIGSVPVPNGRKYGHVAVIVEGAKGATIEETLKKAMVIEALFFDQKTKRFLFNPDDQIRKEPAWESFGNKFKGIRYRLRIPLSEDQINAMCQFLGSQLNARYNVLSLKKSILKNEKRPNRPSWHCATLTWEAFHTAVGIDIDANNGTFIFPSDILASPVFDESEGRVQF